MLEASGITVSFRRRGGAPVKVLDDVSVTVREGGITGLVGESGSGKTTLVRTICGLLKPDAGTVTLHGRPVLGAARGDSAGGAGKLPVSMVFQDAAGALDPRQTAEDSIAEALRVHKVVPPPESPATARELMRRVGLPADVARKRPGEMSGGQCQRVCIARAIAPRPMLLIGDEPVSALDVSVQARILKLFKGLLDSPENGLEAILLVTHDLAVVSAVCDYVYVLEHGRIVEEGEPESIFSAPAHPYTRRLLAAARFA